MGSTEIKGFFDPGVHRDADRARRARERDMQDATAVRSEAFGPSAEETAFLQRLNAQAMGQGPSVAQGLMSQGLQQAQSAAASQAAGSRGVNAGLAARMAMQSQAGLANDAVARAGIMRNQEMMQANEAYGGMLAQLAQRRMMEEQARMGGAQAFQNFKEQRDQMAQQRESNMISGLAQAGMQAGMMYMGMPPKPTNLNVGQASDMTKNMRTPQSNMMLASEGGIVPGQAKTKGDSEKNDTVPALLSPGEIVVPRSIVKKGPSAIKSFAQKLLEET